MTRARTPAAAGGFTLLEVVIALAILATGLTWILRSTMMTVRNAEDSRYYDVVTHLARAKMLDVEEELRKEGFKDTDQSLRGDFADEGWPQIKWEAEVRKVELPSIDQIQAMASGGSGAGTGAEAGEDAGGGMFGMLSMFGGGGGDGGAGLGMLGMFHGIVEQVFEVSIRKVVLTLKWQVIGRDRDLTFVAYFTDAAAMNQVLGGLGAAGAGDYSGGTGGSGGGGTGGTGGRGGSGGGTGGTSGGGSPGGGRR